MDGMVYSAAASLGFATLENLYYVISFGPAVMIARGPLSTLAHVVFGAFWGYALASQSASNQRRPHIVLAGLGSAALVHATFNISVFFFPLVAIVITAAGGIWVASRFRWAARVSPFRFRRNYPLGACRSCLQLVRVNCSYCRFCGVPSPLSAPSLVCGNCRTISRPDASYCATCGDRFIT